MTKLEKIDTIMKEYTRNYERSVGDRREANCKLNCLAHGEKDDSCIVKLINDAKKMVYVINREIPPND